MSLSAHILIVDDSPSNLLLVKRILQAAGYTQVQALSRSSEIVAYFEAHPPDLLLLDLHMPDPDGFEVMRLLARWTTGKTYVPVLVLTADISQDTRHRALEAGARDLLTTPLDHIDVLLRIRNLLQTRDLQLQLQAQNELLDAKVRARTLELDKARLEAFEKLALAAEYRDDDTREHTRRVGHAAQLLALELGLDAAVAEVLAQVAPLHDLGKIAISDAILLKPGRLDARERAAMNEHASIGAQIMSGTNSPLFTLAAEIALCHHEHWDGSGYPNGLAEERIPRAARIVALVDAFDAISHERPYKPAWPLESALDEIRRCGGSQFDADIVEAFLRLDHANLLHPPPAVSPIPLAASAPETPRRQARALTTELLEAVFEHLPHALLLGDHDGRYLAGNAMARELLGMTNEELRPSLRPDDFSLEPHDSADAIWAEFRRVVVGSTETILTRADGMKIPIKTTEHANLIPGHRLTVLERVAAARQALDKPVPDLPT